MHRAHFELTKYALEKVSPKAKLFLNPVVGVTQTVDIDYTTRVLCYKEMIKKYVMCFHKIATVLLQQFIVYLFLILLFTGI